MFTVVMDFLETAADTEAGIAHVQDEVLPALRDTTGLIGLWLVDRAEHRRVTIMVWDSDEHYQKGMAAIQAGREADPGRRRPAPESVQQYEVYGAIGCQPPG